MTFDDAVIVGQKEEWLGIGILRRADSRADGADVVAQVRNACCGNAC